MRHTTLILIGLFWGTFLFSQSSKPNIILVLADDLGYGDLSCYGSKRIQTPNIDAMAKEGLKFTQFYASSTVCTPTRVGILTGQYPLRFNVSTHFNDREMYLDNDVLTIPKLLKTHGYRSMHIGKWHLGGLNEAHIRDRKNSMPGPLQHGFNHYLTMIEDPQYRGVAMREKRLYKDAGKHLVKDDTILPQDSRHWTDIKFDEAVNFVKSASKSNQPFFLNLWLDAPHAPYEYSNDEALAPYQKRSQGQDLLYRGMVTHIDQWVGKLIETLKALNIDQNTLVIFTSDNGPAYLGSPLHFKGRKTDFHEGGIRVPMIAWMPKTIKRDQTTDVISNTVDFLPTFGSFAKVKGDKVITDGMDLSSVLKGKANTLERPTMFWEISTRYANSGNYVNVTDVRMTPVANQIALNKQWKLLAFEGAPKELYNLEEDPYERWNLLESKPEIASKMVKELKAFLDAPRKEKPY